MSKRDQYSVLSGSADALTAKTLPEGYEQLVTSAGNVLAFQGPAEKFSYLKANPAQFKNAGQYDVRKK
jgi:hypothetical protein